MEWQSKPTPALPCPFCLGVFNCRPKDALWLGDNGGDPETARSELVMHMEECERRDDPRASGFVDASEQIARTSAELGLTGGR